MSEPLSVEYLELIKERWARWAAAGLPVSRDRQDLLAEVERLRGEVAEYVRAHELMVAQFKTMQREKEHGWREAERWEDKAETLRGEVARQLGGLDDEQAAKILRILDGTP